MLWNTWRIAGLRTSRTLIGSPSYDTTGRLTRVSLLGASKFQQETTTINPWFISRKRGLGVRQHGGHRCRIWHGILGQPAPLGGNSPNGSLLPVCMQEHSLYILHKSPTKKKKKNQHSTPVRCPVWISKILIDKPLPKPLLSTYTVHLKVRREARHVYWENIYFISVHFKFIFIFANKIRKKSWKPFWCLSCLRQTHNNSNKNNIFRNIQD